MKDKVMKLKDEGIQLPGEKKDKCCYFIPVKVGVMVIGVIMILYAISLFLDCIDWLRQKGARKTYGVMFIVAAAPILVGGVFFGMWFAKMGDGDRKKKTTTACLLVILSAIISLII